MSHKKRNKVSNAIILRRKITKQESKQSFQISTYYLFGFRSKVNVETLTVTKLRIINTTGVATIKHHSLNPKKSNSINILPENICAKGLLYNVEQKKQSQSAIECTYYCGRTNST